MLELLIALSYIAFGIILFKIDIEFNLSRFLYTACFEGAGFQLFMIFYILFSPIVLFSIIWNGIAKFLNYIIKNN